MAQASCSPSSTARPAAAGRRKLGDLIKFPFRFTHLKVSQTFTLSGSFVHPQTPGSSLFYSMPKLIISFLEKHVAALNKIRALWYPIFFSNENILSYEKKRLSIFRVENGMFKAYTRSNKTYAQSSI